MPTGKNITINSENENILEKKSGFTIILFPQLIQLKITQSVHSNSLESRSISQ